MMRYKLQFGLRTVFTVTALIAMSIWSLQVLFAPLNTTSGGFWQRSMAMSGLFFSISVAAWLLVGCRSKATFLDLGMIVVVAGVMVLAVVALIR